MRLFAIYKENCHEDAHVADFVSMGAMNARSVNIRMEDGSRKLHYIRENWAFHSFFDTISPGKKTDAIGIRYSLHEDLVLMFQDVLEKNPHWTLGADVFLEVLGMTLDNCANQNKCAKHYWNLANLYIDIAPRLIVIYLQHRKSLFPQGNPSVSEDHSEAPFLNNEIAVPELNENDKDPLANVVSTNPWPLTINTEFPMILREDVEDILSEVGEDISNSSSLDILNLSSCNTDEAPGVINTPACQAHGSQHQGKVREDTFLEMSISVETEESAAAQMENPWPMVVDGQGYPASDESYTDSLIYTYLEHSKDLLVEQSNSDIADNTAFNFSEVADWSESDYRGLFYDTYWPDDGDDKTSSSADSSGNSTAAMTSDFLDCLDPSTAQFMVGAQTVDEINLRFGDRLNPEWLAMLSFAIRHQYTEPDQGRGAHDGEGGSVKKLCYNGELSGDRSANATGVFTTMTRKRGQKTEIKEMYPVNKWSQQGNERLLRLKLHAVTHRVYKLFLEKWDEVARLRDEGWHHVHYIERTAEDPVGTTKTVVGTSTFKEVYFPRLQQDAIGKRPSARSFVMYSSTLACACEECFYAFNAADCKHKDLREVQQHTMKLLLTTTTPSTRQPRQQESPIVKAAVDRALKRLCDKYGRAALSKKDLEGVIVKELGLPPLTAKQKSGKKMFLVKLAFEAAFEGETLDVEHSVASEPIDDAEPVDEPADDGMYYNDDQEDFCDDEEERPLDDRPDAEDSGTLELIERRTDGSQDGCSTTTF
jgi:hypothetical protein